MANILTAIKCLLESRDINVSEFQEGNNRANNMGAAFEIYIKNLFAGVPAYGTSRTTIQKMYEQAFSYFGNASNPPDLMLRGGDAVEIKKLETRDSQIQLNSSYPKNKLRSNDSRITNHARDAEDWTEKDILYIVGNIEGKLKKIRSMWWVYGDCFCADSSVYISIGEKISSALLEIPDIDFCPTNELGRVNDIDLLKVTSLRIRGMWLLKNPHKIFQDYVEYDIYSSFQLFVLMQEKKWFSFPQTDRNVIEEFEKVGILSISDELVPSPDNPAKSLRCKLIKFVA